MKTGTLAVDKASPCAVVDGNENVTNETHAVIADRVTFTGRQLDSETGLQFNRARYLDQKTGRWTSQDPLGFEGGDENLYRYVMNSPSNLVDPIGMQGIPGSAQLLLTPSVFNTPIHPAFKVGIRSGSKVGRGIHGAFAWAITWEVRPATKKGGWIIQHNKISVKKNGVEVALPAPLDAPENKDYWEAWAVAPATDLQIATANVSSPQKETPYVEFALLKANEVPDEAIPKFASDWYWFAGSRDACDAMTITGKVFYVDNVPFRGPGGFLDAGFKKKAVFAAGSLYSVSDRNGGAKVQALIDRFGAAEPIDHVLKATWSENVNSGRPTIETTPSVPQIPR